MSELVALCDAGPSAGGKAAGLARLCAAGLPVPDGFALTHAAFLRTVGAPAAGDPDPAHALARTARRIETAVIPADLEAAVVARARALGGPVIVRSSVSIEDAARGSAAGVLASSPPVAPDAVWPAIRAVWASACTPLVAHYARRGADAGDLAIGVIVQRHVAGARTTVYTRPPGRPEADEAWLEVDPATGAEPATPLARSATDPRLQLALAAEAAIAAPRGADVELVVGDAIAIVQARAIVHPPARPHRAPPPPALLAPLVADRAHRWRWDVEHNPEPMSAAQAGLVAAVDAAGVAPYRMCTVAGYLYWTTTAPSPAPRVPATAAELRGAFAALEARLARALAVPTEPAPLPIAIDAYLAGYAIWATEVAPLVAAARGGARGGGGSPLARAIADAARGATTLDDILARFGDLALAWDVAAPTLRESPALVAAAIDAARGTAPRPARAPIDETVADAAHELAELDDLWFARAQALVRRSLLAIAAELELADASDVFWLPLDRLRAGERPAPDAAAALARAARAAARRALAWQMPREIGAPGAERTTAGVWRGEGAGRALGTVRKLDGAGLVPPGTVVVARAITPALALLVGTAGAIASETGGILSHGAAIARELGIPFLVGCRGAWDDLADGDRVELDGDAGRLTRLTG